MKTILSTFLILAVLATALSVATADISSAGMLGAGSAFFVTEDANEPHPEAILVGQCTTTLSEDADPEEPHPEAILVGAQITALSEGSDPNDEDNAGGAE